VDRVHRLRLLHAHGHRLRLRRRLRAIDERPGENDEPSDHRHDVLPHPRVHPRPVHRPVHWTGIGSWIAVAGASGLEAIGLTGFAAVIGFMLLASVLNLFIISGSSMWTLMAAVFVPLFSLLGYEPAFIQAGFRV